MSHSDSIRKILKGIEKGQRRDYELLVNTLLDPTIKDEVLCRCLQGLRGCIYMLNETQEVLVGTVLKVNIFEKSDAVFEEFHKFVVELVSAYTYYLKSCLRKVVLNFLPAKEDSIAPTEEIRLKYDKIFSRCHKILEELVKIVPMISELLIPLLHQCFPYLNQHTYIQESYTRNLLQLSRYLRDGHESKNHSQKVMEIIIDRMLKIDLRAHREDIKEAEGDSDNDMEDENIFDMDGVDTSPSDTPADPLRGDTLKDAPMQHPAADRLDIMLTVVLTHLNQLCCPTGDVDWGHTKQLYQQLLNIFDKLILKTFGCCHVQFIMFFICKFKLALSEGFIDYLWKKVTNPNMPVMVRQAAIAYLGGFVARANYIPLETVKVCLILMSDWIHKYIETAAYSNTKPDVTHHAAFYSVCQAFFYLIVFRHKEILDTKRGFKLLQTFNIQTIVTSRLNPLNIVLPVVGKTFSSISRMHQLAFCDTIMEHNRRSVLQDLGSDQIEQSRITVFNTLDSFFPFDPFMLNRSACFILPLYREYDGTPVQDVEPIYPDEDTVFDEALEEPEEASDSLPILSPKSPADFILHGTSPGFKHM